MTKLTNALLLCLLFISGSASAEWVRVDETDELYSYFDPTTIRKDGNLRKVWQIQDLKQRGKAGELSRRYRAEYDCKNDRYRLLSSSFHPQPMASGMSLFQSTEEDTKWTDFPPKTVGETVLKIICAK